MRETAIEIETKVDELLSVLDSDIEQTERSLHRLDELRGLVIKRDDAGMGRLLETIRAESQSGNANEAKRGELQRALAVAVGCRPEQLTLSRLQEELDSPLRAQVAARQEKLRASVEQLKRQYMATAMLLSDCARINGVLLRAVFGRGNEHLVCYDSSGSAARQVETAFVNMCF